jgi:glycosyltransferase A (GT-A) superfamily protein (DUF2064 family)
MATRNHALLLFSKPPIAGTVKTRLTTEKGGPFTEDEAAEIFRRSLFDVAELCCLALHELENQSAIERALNQDADEHKYTLFVSTTPEGNVETMKKTFEDIGQWPREFVYITDEGETLDDHYDDAFKKVFAQGFDSILSVGADIPMLPREHLLNGFKWLHYFLVTSEKGGLVHAPCQEAGVSLIGWTRDTAIDHQGVNENASARPALDTYVEKARDKEIPMALLMPVSGIDDVSDFAHATSMARAAKYSQQFQPDLYVPERFLAWVDWRGLKVGTPPEEE